MLQQQALGPETVTTLLPPSMMASGIDSGAGHGGLMRQVHGYAPYQNPPRMTNSALMLECFISTPPQVGTV